jgi:threonine dehydratase
VRRVGIALVNPDELRVDDQVMHSLDRLEEAASLVHSVMPPTPQYAWPLLGRRTGAEVWVKHENMTPIGAFKVRGGLAYLADLKRRAPSTPGIISATRGNHGQSLALAARRIGLSATLVVPRGNSVEKNAAMRGFGAELVEHGHDFQEAAEFCEALAAERKLHFVRSFHPLLVLGVASYALELFRAVEDLDTVYVPIGMGSGICGTMAVRDALGLETKIVGVVASGAPCYALSFAAGRPVPTNSSETMADGLACRTPSAEAFELIRKGADRIVTVADDEIKAAMRAYYTDTHNLAEGAGAAAFAALMQEREKMRGRRVAVILSGGNIDKDLYRAVLAED